MILQTAQFIVEMHSDVSEQVFVDIDCSVATSSWYNFLLLLVEHDVLLKLLGDGDDFMVSEVCFVIAAPNLGQVTLLLHLSVFPGVLICDGTILVFHIRNQI